MSEEEEKVNTDESNALEGQLSKSALKKLAKGKVRHHSTIIPHSDPLHNLIFNLNLSLFYFYYRLRKRRKNLFGEMGPTRKRRNRHYPKKNKSILQPLLYKPLPREKRRMYLDRYRMHIIRVLSKQLGKIGGNKEGFILVIHPSLKTRHLMKNLSWSFHHPMLQDPYIWDML
jgi:hypothetical protein